MDDGYIKSATATVQNGVAKADGKLSVTTSSIHFEPYNKEFGLGPYELDRNAVVKVKKCWGKGGWNPSGHLRWYRADAGGRERVSVHCRQPGRLAGAAWSMNCKRIKIDQAED